MNELIPFNHPEFGQLRYSLKAADKPDFCCKDIAEALEYKDTHQLNNLFSHVPEQWKGHNPIMTPGGPQLMLTVTLSGLNFFVGRSDKPKALPYQMWLADEVVPSIMKHGGYLTPAKVEEILTDPDTLIRLATNLKAERAARVAAEARETALIEVNATLAEDNAAQAAKIEADAPLVDFAKLYAEADKLFLVADLAKDITIHIGVRFSEITLFRYLRSRGVVHIAGSEYNMPTQGYVDKGYMTIKTTVKTVGANDDPRVFRTPAITTTGMIYFMTKFRRLAEKGELSESGGIKLIPPPKADE